jgi:uncharacterized protein (DUF302 family)
MSHALGEISRDDYLQTSTTFPLAERSALQVRCLDCKREFPMSYYFSKTLPVGFDEAVRRSIEGLKQEGFGIITEIDLKETFKKKINVDFRNYRILGACNPMLAHEALKLEDKVGTMLPCNVVVQDVGGGRTEVGSNRSRCIYAGH